MSDDLVKRLRNTGSMSHAEVWETFEEAADRIEELEAKLAAAKYEIDFCHAQLEAWQSMAPPATKGLFRKRLAELKGDT